MAWAERQHGLIAIWQVRASGATRDDVYRLRRSTHWEARSPRVLARKGAPATERQHLMAAVLDASPGAVVAGPSAARMWGAPGFRDRPVHVVRPKGIARRPSALAVVHEVVDLHASHVKVLDGVPVVSPARVVCELAGTLPHRAEAVLDRFWAERLLDGRTFARTVEEMRDRGRKGSTFFRELDEMRGPTYVPPASGLERRFQSICEFAMDRQVDLGAHEWCGRVDFKDPVLPLIVEVQSERFHTALVDRAADAARRTGLEAAGFIVVEAWDNEIWHQPGVVNDRIRQARRRLQSRAA